ncbi:MAG: phosphoadenosine phosphosulfate reductase family protein, partial [Candidatus Tectimicrobiota bacterium]
NPLADWSLEEVERYVQDHGIPYNPLYDRGYKSVGCWPCTQPVSPEEGIRDGRWSGQDKQECGIWFVNGTVSRQPPPGEPDHERGDDDGR